MSAVEALAPGEGLLAPGSRARAGLLDRVAPLGWEGVGALRATAALLLGASLLLAPFEGQLFTVRTSVLTFTDLELAATATLLLWALSLVMARRLPAVTRGVAIGLGALAVISFASALSAATFGDDALRFATRSLGFWLLFLAAADLVRTERSATRLVVWLLAGATVSAAIGWLSFLAGSASGLPGAGRLFTVGGVARVAGTFDYPNTAASFWQMTLLAALPLLALPMRRGLRLALTLALVAVGGALLLTYSRGALVGALCGVAAIAGLALLAGRLRTRRIGLLTAGTALALVAGAAVVQLGGSLPLSRLVADSDQTLYGVRYEAPASIDLAPGQETQVAVALTNTGQATWAVDGTSVYHLSYHWLDPQTGAIVLLDGARTSFSAPVSPGERVQVMATVAAPASRGEYLLAWDVTQEGVTWFSEKRVPTATTAVLVGEATPTTPIGGGGSVDLFPDVVPVPSRAELWSAAVTMAERAPLLGVGPGTFRLRYGEVLGWPRWDDRIHANDLYLEVAATTGVLGLLALLALLTAALVPQLRGVLRRRGGGPPLDDAAWLLRAGLVGAVVGFLAHGIVDYFLGFTPTAILAWTLLGMGLGIALASRRTADQEALAAPEVPTS